MRLNQYLAHTTGLSRRRADALIAAHKVTIDGKVAEVGQQVEAGQTVRLEDQPIASQGYRTVMFHKPVGYITSRRQQGSAPTIYELLPAELHHLKPVGRLDKDSSGLLLLTNDGRLAQQLGHPSSGKWKHYWVQLNRPLTATDLSALEQGVPLDDGISRLKIEPRTKGYGVSLQEGRNRQIRRSFAARRYRVVKLHREQMGKLQLGRLKPGAWRELSAKEVTL